MTYKITGIPIPAGATAPPVRMEINNMADSMDEQVSQQFSLFIRALLAFQQKPVDDQLGYFQIAGIHSEPMVPWDGVAQKDGKEFCAHDQITFPTWHRAYMLLFEQRLWEIMKNEVIPSMKIPSDSVKQKWLEAADNFRLPYWDWALEQDYLGTAGLPWVCVEEQLHILGPSGKTEGHANPLWVFINPKKVAFGDPSMGKNAIKVTDKTSPPWDKALGTSRYGMVKEGNNTWTGLDGVNNWEFVNDSLHNPAWYSLKGGEFKEAVSRMFAPGYLRTWSQFATVARDSNDNVAFMSLEYIHNNVHNDIGGTKPNRGVGQIADVPVAAFDPVFWLHHCNIDRLLSMWQKINPDLWFDDRGENDPKETDPLYPFHKDAAGAFHTSQTLRDTAALGYTYQDLVPLKRSLGSNGSLVQKEYAKQVRASVQNLYRSTALLAQENIEFPGFAADDDRKSFWDYLVNVVYDRYALPGGGSYTINFYLGEAAGIEAEESVNHENLCGKVYTFSNDPARCTSCAGRGAAEKLSVAQIVLTSTLTARFKRDIMFMIRRSMPRNASGTMMGMDPESVEAYLQANLRWEFVDRTGQVRPASDFPKTKVFVLRGKGLFPKEKMGSGEMATYGQYEPMYPATEGKDGGVGKDDREYGSGKLFSKK